MSADTLQTSYTRFSRALLRAAFSSAGMIHVDYKIKVKPEEITIWVPRKSHNDTHPPLKESSDPDAHRRFAQGVIGSVMGSAGMVAETHVINAEPYVVEFWFEPKPDAKPLPGLCGRMAHRENVFKPLVKLPPHVELSELALDALQLVLRPKRKKDLKRVRTWVISNDIPAKSIDYMGLRPAISWPPGAYMGAPGFGLCALHLRELPQTRETLIVRLLGTESVLEAAFSDVAQLQPRSWERRVLKAALTEVCAADSNVVSLAEDGIHRKCRKAYETWYQRLVLGNAAP